MKIQLRTCIFPVYPANFPPAVDQKKFELIVSQAIDSLPEEFGRGLTNIEIVIEDKPPFKESKKSLLLGLYEGIPISERGDTIAGVLPDKITLFKKNIEAVCEDEEEMVKEIRLTLLHEIGHFFGMTEEELRRLGYG